MVDLDDVFSEVAEEVSKTEVVAVTQNKDEWSWKHILQIKVSYGVKVDPLIKVTNNILRILNAFECEHMSRWMNNYKKTEDGQYLMSTNESINLVCIGFDFKHRRRSYCYAKCFVEALEKSADIFSDVLSLDNYISIGSNMEFLYSTIMGDFKYESRLAIDHNDRIINYGNYRNFVISSAANEWALNYKIKRITFDESLNDIFVGFEFKRHLSGNSSDMMTGGFYFHQNRILRGDFHDGEFFTTSSFIDEVWTPERRMFEKNQVIKSYVVRSENYRELYIFEINHPKVFYNWFYLDIDHTIGFENTKFALEKIFGDSKETKKAIGTIKKKLFKNHSSQNL